MWGRLRYRGRQQLCQGLGGIRSPAPPRCGARPGHTAVHPSPGLTRVVVAGLIRPASSAFLIMLYAMRSLTLQQGCMSSSLHARLATHPCLVTLFKKTCSNRAGPRGAGWAARCTRASRMHGARSSGHSSTPPPPQRPAPARWWAQHPAGTSSRRSPLACRQSAWSRPAGSRCGGGWGPLAPATASPDPRLLHLLPLGAPVRARVRDC